MKSGWSIFRVCIIAGLFTASLQAQHRAAGSINYQHLLLDYDARSVGMAGASVAIPGNVLGTFVNPATVASIRGIEGFIGYQMVIDGVWGAPVGVTREFPGIGVFTVAFQGLTSGRIEVVEVGYDNEPLYTGLSAFDEYVSAGVSYARTFFNDQLHTGITFKGLYHRIKEPLTVHKAKGTAFDLGLQYYLLSDRLIVGAVVRNAGVEVTSFVLGESYPLPLIFEAGVSYVPRYLSSVRLALDINKIRGDYFGFEPGLEVEIYPQVLFARFGYAFSQKDLTEQFRKFSGNQDENYQKSNWSSFCTGIGIRTDIRKVKVQIDIGLEFRVSWLPPSPVVSASVEF